MSLLENFTQGHVEDEINNTPLQLAVLIASTGSASTLRSLVEAIKSGDLSADVRMVIANMSSAPGLAIAEKNGITALKHGLFIKDRNDPGKVQKHSSSIAQELNNNGIQAAIFAGWPIILDKIFFDQFNGIAINIHPGLVPDTQDGIALFPDGTKASWNRGLMTDKAVENFLGGSYGGSTIHVATAQTDFGPVLKRVFTPVEPDDTAESLYKRLKVEEQKGLIEELNKIRIEE